MDQIYYLIFIGLVISVCFYWTKMQKVQFELEKKNLELELQEVYGAAYKELIFEVRRKQHDFMNQLGAVYSMHMTATSLEELIEIHVDTAECKLSLHEVIEILGILLTNAFESIVGAVAERKLIELVVEEACENLCIEVSNLSKYLTSGEIEKIFNKGYSSKGKNRGIGLARVKQLVEKSGSDIIVENYMRTEEIL